MQISERTALAVGATIAFVALSARISSNTANTETEPVVAAQAPVSDFTPSSNYDRLARPKLSDPRDGVQSIPVTPMTTATLTPRASKPSKAAQNLQEDLAALPTEEPTVDANASADQNQTVSPEAADPTATLAQTAPSAPARAGELTDQGVYELFVSSLDAENRRSFRITWQTMSPEERQDWLQNARLALSGN